jgi:hypothetical protein
MPFKFDPIPTATLCSDIKFSLGVSPTELEPLGNLQPKGAWFAHGHGTLTARDPSHHLTKHASNHTHSVLIEIRDAGGP